MQNEHVMIVGGTAGLGRLLANRFAAKNCQVSVLGRRESISGAMEESELIQRFRLDLTEFDSIQQVVRRCLDERGKVRYLIFCQRYRGNDDPWTGEYQVGLVATRTIIDLCAGAFDPEGAPGIVIVSSAAARFVLSDQPVSYHVIKAGLNQLARFYAVTLGPVGIRVNTVSPDMYIKEEARKAYEEKPELQALRKLYDSITPLGRMGTTDDAADMIEFLCSPRASFVTGQDFIVDGGLSLTGHAALARQLVSK